MNTNLILIILSINHIAISETPALTCLPQKPFQTDINCGDFNDVCVKKDDFQCNNFQAACQQCPPTNYTVSMLLHLNSQLNRSNLNKNKIKNQINILSSLINVSLNKIVKQSTDQVGIGTVCLIFILLNFIFDIFVFLKDKCFKKKKIQKESLKESQCLINNQQIMYSDERFQAIINENNIQLLNEIKENNNAKDERFQAIINENNIQLLNEIKENNNAKDERFQAIINENNRQLLNEIKEKHDAKENDNLLKQMQESIKAHAENSQAVILKNNDNLIREIRKMKQENEYLTLESVVCHKLRFQVANQFDETELIVSKFDNVIKLKKLICDRNMSMNDYKRMIMKYKGVTVDNNQYLLSCIDSTNIPIFCEFDNNVDVNAMIVIKLKCNNIYPEMIQIWRDQQIKDLKIIISKLNKTNHKDLLIVYKSNELDDDDKTIDDYKIEDNDWIQVANKSE